MRNKKVIAVKGRNREDGRLRDNIVVLKKGVISYGNKNLREKNKIMGKM